MSVCGGGRYKAMTRKWPGPRGWGTTADVFLGTKAIFMVFLFHVGPLPSRERPVRREPKDSNFFFVQLLQLFVKHVMNNFFKPRDVNGLFLGIEVKDALQEVVNKPDRSSHLAMDKRAALQLDSASFVVNGAQ